MIDSALHVARKVKEKYPASQLPDMYLGSIYYLNFADSRRLALDSAQAIFTRILLNKPHYGPAHNGLASVIRSRRIPFQENYDAIQSRLKNFLLINPETFHQVFPNISDYPGRTVQAMVWNQLYTATVYFPFLAKQGESFRIPPLHHDLAIAMKSPSFRFMTTFDNRQWMDIRGVGSGAAGIEYVEKGAFGERNVLLHEYVHLFHGTVLTDEENRKIRALYYKAMEEGRTLDYYSQNNESEYFAQTYPAYFEAVKVHPLDFKSMNTRSDLQRKDPEMFSFIHKLVSKERAYQAGDHKAMASNWAQVYLNLSQKAPSNDAAIRYVDTALQYDRQYLPAYIRMAALKKQQNNVEEAASWLDRARKIDPNYAPVYTAMANLLALTVAQQAERLHKAISLETDYQELASVHRQLRELYFRNGQTEEAIKAAEAYVSKAATISTYLRDRRDDALVFAASQRAKKGDATQLSVLSKIVAQKPQHFEYRNQYADALAANGQYETAIATLESAQRILTASGTPRQDFDQRIKAYRQKLEETRKR
ncbi:tetratricopeptide repeat protein [Pedobacter faecalis]|uniref:tetratricopeptide repeat protein n=1 Tax=Pedobacter faecalis TaxID=3041495 RepID=UPI00254DA596|nr:tetratricopeptide repeat protein [Pedobacter sp. ELA7]